MEFTDQQIERYARHIVLKEVGGAGQTRLLESRVLVVGAGGLGSPLLMYLAAAGVGTIAVIDDDEVSLSNLQRQVIHTTRDLGTAKVDSARDTVRALNPDIEVICLEQRLEADNALGIIGEYDLVADGSDNFATRFLISDACFLSAKTLVSAAVGQFEGQLSTYKAFEGGANPCYRCIFPEPPPPGAVPSCAEGGIIGSLAGVMGSLQATEVIKELAQVGETLSGRLLIYDALDVRFRTIRVRPDPACSLCGAQASIRDLSAHAA